MGYAFGVDENGREIGYGVEAECDWPGCEEKIDRGMAYQCGAGEERLNEDEPFCCDFFCGKHKPGEVCLDCEPRLECPDCKGTGGNEDGLCEGCDSLGALSLDQWFEKKEAA